MYNILISGYYGFDNIGDESILRTLVTSLRERIPDCSLTVLSHDPAATREKYGVEAVERMSPLAIARAVRRCDMLISGGGSLLQDVTSSKSLHYYLAIIRFAQLPLFTIAFITFLRCCRQGFASLERGITIAFWIIAAVALLSALTGTNPYTYPDKRIGLCGWFYFANSQSAILSMLVPLALCPALRSGQIRRWLPIAVVGFAELFCFATRLAYMSLFVTAIGMVITLALTKRGSAKVCAVLLLCAAICAAGYTVSPIHRNQQAVAANAVRKQENIDRLVAQGKAEFGDQGYAYLTYAYDEYLGGTVERYGLEATAETYGYSTKAADITNVRTIKINYCRLMLNTEPLTSRLFGLSYDEMTYHGYCYDVENDFHGIAYLYGWAGLACLLAFLGYFLVIIVCALIRNARRYFTVEAGACGVALCTALAHIYNTAGVLRRPNASFYLCLILASIWYLIYIRDYDDSKEN